MPSKIEKRLLNPKEGSEIKKAKEFGIDLTLLIERLKLTPEQRIIELQKSMNYFNQIRGAALKKNKMR